MGGMCAVDEVITSFVGKPIEFPAVPGTIHSHFWVALGLSIPGQEITGT